MEEKKITTSFTADKETFVKIEELAKKEKRSKSNIIRMAIDELYEKLKA